MDNKSGFSGLCADVPMIAEQRKVVRLKTWAFSIGDAAYSVGLEIGRKLSVRIWMNGEPSGLWTYSFTSARLSFPIGETTAFICAEREGRRRILHLHVNGQ